VIKHTVFIWRLAHTLLKQSGKMLRILKAKLISGVYFVIKDEKAKEAETEVKMADENKNN
jgi:hypothetical protein